MKKIAIFGGTFDPIHKQHVRIAKVAYEKLQLSELWFLPNKCNPLKKSSQATVQQRITMIKLAIKDIPWIKLVDYEMMRKTVVNYTIDTICHFQKLYPDVYFYFLIGSDNLWTLKNWKKIDELVKKVQFVIINRPCFKNSPKLMEKYNCIALEIKPSSTISSTQIRAGKIINQLNPLVNQYINEQMLYYQKRLAANLDDKRIVHSINTGKMAVKLANIHGVDSQKACIAGTYHDIAKQWSDEKLTKYLIKYAPNILQEHVNLYHSYAGAMYVKHHWKHHDDAIISAIMKHTTGALTMSKLDLIVFLADKVSCERQYDFVKTLRKMAFQDLEKAFVKYLEILKTSLTARNIIKNSLFEAIYEHWKLKTKP